MAEKIILNTAEKKLKERTTVAGAKSSIRALGWWIALWPVFLTVSMLIEIVSGVDFPLSLSLIFAAGLMLLVMYDLQYMRTFFGANFRTGAWTAGTFFLGGPVSCVYLFLRKKHIKSDNRLSDIMHTQAVVSLIGWIGLAVITIIYIILSFPAIIQEAMVPDCNDSDVKKTFVEVVEENNNVSNVKIGKVVEVSYNEGMRTCNALNVTYTDLGDLEDTIVPSVTYTVESSDGMHYLVTIK